MNLHSLSCYLENIDLSLCVFIDAPNITITKHLSKKSQVANDYRALKKTKLQRTFVSASDAAEDRARGVKREGGIIVDGPARKTNKIEFVKPGQIEDTQSDDENTERKSNVQNTKSEVGPAESTKSEVVDNTNSERVVVEEVRIERPDYLLELSQINCLDVRKFRTNMFETRFGKLVLLVRTWVGKFWNIQSSCQICGVNLEYNYDNETGRHSVDLNGIRIAQAEGATKSLGKKTVGEIAWNVIKEEIVMIVVKEQFIAQNDTRISVNDVSGRSRDAGPKDEEFGTPVEASVASKMMKMMGWKGGGLGADSQGIAEPIKPHLQMVQRAGLGSNSSDIRQIRRAAEALMRRYLASDCLDVDLVFSSDFSKEERAALHQVSKNARLVSRSYGQGDDRFLVVKKKINPFALVEAVIEKGGVTPKYQVFIPATLDKSSRRQW